MNLLPAPMANEVNKALGGKLAPKYITQLAAAPVTQASTAKLLPVTSWLVIFNFLIIISLVRSETTDPAAQDAPTTTGA